VPRIQAAALRAAGVSDAAISIIPDEQEAIDAALRMGQPGDLLLIFADALVRSWKQITKFRPAGVPAPSTLPEGESLLVQPASSDVGQPAGRQSGPRGGAAEGLVDAPAPALNLEGLIRDERGVRFAPETED
jgi:cyanophycin synthetase